MKYKLETDDKQEYWKAFHGADLYRVLWDLDNDVLRKYIKYDDSLSNEQIDIVEKIRDSLYEIMSEHGVDFNNIS